MAQGYSPLFDKKSKGKSFLLKVEEGEQMSVQSSVIKDAIEKDFEVAVIGFQHPYNHLKEKIGLSEPLIENIWFIDCITREVGGEEEDDEKLNFVDSPSNLDHVRANISLITQNIDKKLLIIIDSVPAVLAFNDEKKTSNFLKRTIESAETYDARFVLFKESEKLDSLIGGKVYPYIDEFLLLTKEELNIVEKEGETYIRLIPDIMRAIDWKQGDKLKYKIQDDKTVQFSRA